MRTVTVEASVSYQILIGKGLLAAVGTETAKRISPCKAALITDSVVEALYADTVRTSLEKAGFSVCTFSFPAGEASKRISTLEQILEFLAEEEMTRQDIIVALGGGVVGDMAGFAAAVYQRGIRFIQIPTTFLAAVDSSVGGKTAIDLAAGKNMAGAFYQPHLVVCDIDTLQTLPQATFADGCAEVVKYGVIGNEALFEQVKDGCKKEELEEIIEACVKMKRDIVMEDEFDTGTRQLLNLGHTLGHAIEKKSDFSITHGSAVAMGLSLIAQIAEQRKIAQAGITDRIKQALTANHLPTEAPYSAAEIAQETCYDKKRRGNTITFVFPERIGACRLEKIPVSAVEEMVAAALAKR